MRITKAFSAALSLLLCISCLTEVSAKENPRFSEPEIPQDFETEEDEFASGIMYYADYIDYANDEGWKNLIRSNEMVGSLEGISWDAETLTLTFDNVNRPAVQLRIESDSYDHDEYVNIVLKGDSQLFRITAYAPIRISGSGSLTLGVLSANYLETMGGTLNLDSECWKYYYKNWPTNEHTGAAIVNNVTSLSNGLYTYRFLGGEVNIAGDYTVGINVQSGNIDIADTKINIDIQKYGRHGIVCGLDDHRDTLVGGSLMILDSDITIHTSQNNAFLIYFYRYTDGNLNLKYYSGKDKMESRLTYEETFRGDSYGSLTRYSRNTIDFPGQNYLRITDMNLFSDVLDPERYFYEPVYWAYQNQITTGTSPDAFSPDQNVSRGQMVTFLYRLAGQPEISFPRQFDDVDPSRYYAKPIAWAASRNITTGYYGTNDFGPDDNCTREQIVTFLWRYVGSPAPQKKAEFTDARPGAYYLDALSWAAENDITVGLNDGTGRFGVGMSCTRAMCVTFLYRYHLLTAIR